MHLKNLILAVFYILGLFVGSWAQSRSEINKHLSNSSVTSIFQDSQGYMWFGTFDGLNRYNGYEVKIYRNQLHNANSIPHNYIYCITEDHNKNLWIGTGQGLGIYNRNFDSFNRLSVSEINNPQNKYPVNVAVKSIQVDQNNNVYICTNGWGLLYKSDQKETAIQIPCPQIKGKDPLYYYHAAAVHIDHKEQVWVLISDEGLYQIDKKNNMLKLVTTDLQDATSITSNNRGELFIGNYSGIFVWNIQTKEVVRHYQKELGFPQINALAFEGENKLWAASQNNGISVIDIAKNQIKAINRSTASVNALDNNSIYSIFIDVDHKKWIGTRKSGIDILVNNHNKFNEIQHKLPLGFNLAHQSVRSFGESSSHLWIGTEGHGLYCWDRANNTYQHFKKDDQGLPDNNINSILIDKKKNVWIATEHGIARYSVQSGFKNYNCITSSGLINDNVQVLLQDTEGTIWATAFSNGHLYRYEASDDRFLEFDNSLNDLNCLLDDQKGYLWAGNYNELIQINKHTKAVNRYPIGKPIRALFQDKQQRLWIGTEGKGLIAFDTNLKKISAIYSTNEGLSNNAVLKILEDGTGNLWLTTFDGLSKFNTKTKRFLRYETTDGLQSNEFSYGAALMLKDGNFLLGGTNGFDLFHPDSIRSLLQIPNLAITGLKIDNHQIDINDKRITIGSNKLLEQIILPYHEGTFSLDYTALEFSSPQKIRYRYILEGWDKNWNDAGTSRSINYNHLQEGNYSLRIQSTDTEGNWTDKEIKLTIQILPPWFRTWWAYLIYAFSIGFLIYRYRIYRKQQTALQLEIQLSKFTVQKERELSEKRNAFFTHVSHEFRTPLTLIINPLKKMLQDRSITDDEGSLQVVHRNAKRLLSLVDQLLIFKKAEDDAEQLHNSQFDLTAFTEEIYLYFYAQAKLQHIDYRLETNGTPMYVEADREKIEIILCNLISNAFKFTPNQGRINVRLQQQDNDILIQIQDSGQGIPSHLGERIFDKYFSDSTKGPKKQLGFGIGMFLTKLFTEMHRGSIRYKNAEEGTIFDLTLPIGLKGAPLAKLDIQTKEEEAKALFHDFFIPESTVLSPVDKTGKIAVASQKYSLLLVDDDIQLRNYLYDLFITDYFVYTASNGAQALQIIREKQPELVITDLIMNEMDGIALCKAVKSDPNLNHIQMILLTSSTSDINQISGIQSGVDDYILKPFDADILTFKVKTLLQNRKNLKEFFLNAITLQSNELKISAQDKALIERCIQTIETHLLEDFNVKTLAEKIGMSHSALYKKIKAISGKSVNEFIRSVRLKKAAELLISTDAKINEVANSIGFEDLKYFREQFHKLFGLNPSEYIKKYRKVFHNEYRIERD